eukprot:5735303-Prorocentrum_lima.AAC.1
MFAKRDKPQIKVTKPWWMKHFLHLQGTSLKPGQKVDQQTWKHKPTNTENNTLVVPNDEAQSIPEIE